MRFFASSHLVHAPLAGCLVASCLSIADARAADCATPYGLDSLLGDLVAIEDALRSGQDPAAAVSADRLEAGLGCLGDVLPSMIAGRAYRAVAAGHIAGGEPAIGGQWFRTAAELEQSFDYGLEDLPESHPVRDAYATARTESSGDQVQVEGKAFVAAGTLWMDGRKLDDPAARLDRPHVVQHEDGGVRSWVIDGNAFPDELLVEGSDAVVAAAPVMTETIVGKVPKSRSRGQKPPKAAKAPREAKPKPAKPPKEPKTREPRPAKEPKPEKEPRAETPKPAKEPRSGASKPKPKKPRNRSQQGEGGVVLLERQRPWEKTPLMIGGGVILAGAGGLYFASLQKKQAFLEGDSLDEIKRLKQQNNRLVIASAAVFGVGAGTLTWGVILDGATPLPGFGFRF